MPARFVALISDFRYLDPSARTMLYFDYLLWSARRIVIPVLCVCHCDAVLPKSIASTHPALASEVDTSPSLNQSASEVCLSRSLTRKKYVMPLLVSKDHVEYRHGKSRESINPLCSNNAQMTHLHPFTLAESRFGQRIIGSLIWCMHRRKTCMLSRFFIFQGISRSAENSEPSPL